jgi:DNA-binding response OmpR family regulator
MEGGSKTKILVVDDDQQLLREVAGHLDKLGYAVETAEDGPAAMALAGTMRPDLVILDISFSDTKTPRKQSIDGIEVLRRLRESGTVPILMLSATSVPSVKVMALHIGADDYLTKPFDRQELGARVEAILRRTRSERTGFQVLNFRRLRLNPGERRVWKDDRPVELTAREFDLLYSLARRPHHVFTRERLLEIAWKEPSYSIPKVVDVHIGHIRRKIEDDPGRPAFIVTVRGTGYKFEDTPV